MKIWQDLLGTDYGLMSLLGILFMIGMAIFFVIFFIRKSALPENHSTGQTSDGQQVNGNRGSNT